MLSALRGAVGFLSRVPVGRDDGAWEAFTARPVVFPLVGYALGAALAVVVLVPAPPATVALAFVVAVYALTGINHADGVTDLGDAAVVHGPPERRREVMKDTTVGTGGALAITVIGLGLATAGLGVAGLAASAVVLVVTAEVAAKTGMALVICLGTATHEGLASPFTTQATAWSAVPVVVVGGPSALLGWPLLGWPAVLPGVAAFTGGVVAALSVLAWARRALGGVNGDVIGAVNEIGRVAALHTGVVAWTLS